MRRLTRAIEYPTSDGKPMAETDFHRDQMMATIETLKISYTPDPSVYVSGNLLIYYEEGNRRKHVSPDVFVVRGVGMRQRLYYLIWEEGKSPEAVIEITSKTTRREDLQTKKVLYRDTLKVKEYFLFDPFGEYLKPRLQGFRLRGSEYIAIRPVDGRLPSHVLGLHLECDGHVLRLYNPATGNWLPTPAELASESRQRAGTAEERAKIAENRAKIAEHRAKIAEERAKIAEERANSAEKRKAAGEAQEGPTPSLPVAAAEIVRLQLEIDNLRRQLGDSGP
jgi:Uma2 family endonuclease